MKSLTWFLKESLAIEEKTRIERISSPTVDLITFPKDVTGTNCGNCEYFDNNYCKNKEVLSPVTDHMCCNRWDHKGTTRQWEKK